PTTHATILTLKAFVKSLSAMVQDADGVVAIEVNGTQVTPLVVNEDNKDVFQQFELKPMLNKQGENEVAVDFKGEGSLMYQIVWWSFVPYETAPVEPQGQLKIEVSYDKTKLTVDDSVTATVNVFNLLPDPAPMVLVDLGIPPGFDVVTDSLEEMVKTGEIMKFEMTGKQIIVYIDEIEPLGKLTLTYILKAKYPLKATAPSSSASLYYDPESKTDSGTQEIEVY
ncbi:MAG: hypothetical protein FJ088_16705, partial [Deltaproteobacteria bacterium]|nr:hypothetical protein [Deltaproteobacteria bacterium]